MLVLKNVDLVIFVHYFGTIENFWVLLDTFNHLGMVWYGLVWYMLLETELDNVEL